MDATGQTLHCVRMLAVFCGQIQPLVELCNHVWLGGLQVRFPGKAVPLVRFSDWAGIQIMPHNCSWLGKSSGCASQLAGAAGWTLLRHGHRSGFVVRQGSGCGYDQAGPQAVAQHCREQRGRALAGLSDHVDHWMCSTVR